MTKQRKRQTVPSGTEKKLVGRRVVSRMAATRKTPAMKKFTGCQGETAYDA
jgi:hypothetical protein